MLRNPAIKSNFECFWSDPKEDVHENATLGMARDLRVDQEQNNWTNVHCLGRA